MSDPCLMMEFVGAFFGYHGDKAIGEYWRRHGATGFPHWGDRSTFVRQLANLGQIKALLHPHWAGTLGAFEAPVPLVDGFPVPVCPPKRVSRHTLFRGEADWGFCASQDPYDFGFHAMLLTTAEGVIAGVTLTAASMDERDSVFDLPLLERIRGALLGDKGFIRPVLTEDLSGMGIALPTPWRDHMKDSRPKSFVAQIVSVRRRIETVIGQLAESFSMERNGARKLLPLVSRIYRKVAAHTLGVLINQSLGRPLLEFEGWVTV
ncbi:IS982 family transposase [Candidatus Accumulibacter cognatus]|nr:IS982 family transposase [Candidatus Accumulibacter cognatus]